MSVCASVVEDNFLRGVDEIAAQAITAYRLTFRRQSQPDLNAPLLRWLDFTLRYIPRPTASLPVEQVSHAIANRPGRRIATHRAIARVRR